MGGGLQKLQMESMERGMDSILFLDGFHAFEDGIHGMGDGIHGMGMDSILLFFTFFICPDLKSIW